MGIGCAFLVANICSLPSGRTNLPGFTRENGGKTLGIPWPKKKSTRIWVLPKNRGKTLKSMEFFDRICHEKIPSILGVLPAIFGNSQKKILRVPTTIFPKEVVAQLPGRLFNQLSAGWISWEQKSLP